MSNPSKNKGTAGETAVVKYARQYGFPLAERIALHGAQDHGDVRLTAGLILEVKAGKAAQTASLRQIGAWLREAHTEAINDHADAYGLVVQRRGVGVDRVHLWDVWIPDVEIITADADYPSHVIPTIMVDLSQALNYWRALGYGDPLNV